MNLEELRKLAESFFEWPTEDRTQVTLTSALLFAQHVLDIALFKPPTAESMHSTFGYVVHFKPPHYDDRDAACRKSILGAVTTSDTEEVTCKNCKLTVAHKVARAKKEQGDEQIQY